MQRGPTFFVTFPFFGQSISACSDGLPNEIEMHISLAIEWILEFGSPLFQGADCPGSKLVILHVARKL